MNPIRYALRHPQVVYVLAAIIFLVGVQALLTMPRREDPKVTIRSGLVVTLLPGATASQMEEQVTRPVEDRLFQFPEVHKSKTFSTTRAGESVIRVELEGWVTSPDEFWSKLRHELNEIRPTHLPAGVAGPMVDSEFGDVVAILLAVQGERFEYRELKDHADRIEDELRSLPAMSKITRVGEQGEQIEVTSTLDRLAQYGLNPLQVIGALQEQNVIAYAGAFDVAGSRAPLRTTGLYQSSDQIRNQIVGVSPDGQPIQLGDFAGVERRYQDPSFLVRVNGRPALLLALEMHEGRNIVEFGRSVDARLDEIRDRFPADLELTAVADQPRLVSQRVGSFLWEFGLAILAVILTTMILLPFRVAAIAATIIPLSIAVTFGVMQILGIELHQVSLAGLIVVLGMVVDDAIVISDNYIELLDRGVPVEEAAFRSANDLALPIAAATLTIIAAFAPLAFLSGETGEFIRGLPLTVIVALACSFVIAMVLTPVLCRAFLREGLATRQAEEPGAKPSPLARMQGIYDRAIGRAMRHRRVTMAAAVAAIIGGVILLETVEERFFPPAERDQFAIDVWLPEGGRLEATDRVMRQVEEALAAEDEVVSFAAFVGGGSPRFYYSFDPPIPGPNVGQLVVNTSSVDATTEIVSRLRRTLPERIPVAELKIREMQQGPPTPSPVEARLSGPDLALLKELGDEITGIFRSLPQSDVVHSDHREEVFGIEVEIDPQVANRLAISNGSVARTLLGSFLGLPVSTFWEGDRAVDIVLRLEESRRENFEDIQDTYVFSSVTGARVPLRELATLTPEWHPSRIVRRNGIRTITIGSTVAEGWLASQLFEEAQPRVAGLELPPGYRIEWGGEWEDQMETFAEMVVALLISLFCIFVILLFQFGSMREVMIVMISIPLALFGAALGLVITRNPFGFTAFLGLISLTGIVVRNAIILVDCIREQRSEGSTVAQAALDAGKRRLRPIFLTTISAAAGVTPMILSGSGLWAPLGSVIAVGLVSSMAATLIVVPVLYVVTTRDTPMPALEGR